MVEVEPKAGIGGGGWNTCMTEGGAAYMPGENIPDEYWMGA
jgi:hypothetical protein